MEKKVRDNAKNNGNKGIIYKRENIIKWALKQTYNLIINGYYEKWSERLYIIELNRGFSDIDPQI